jgi:hypothetical protein
LFDVLIADGLVSYRVSQGNGRSNGPGLGDLRDVGYDGDRLSYGTKRGVLSNGLGQLVDGISTYLGMTQITRRGFPGWDGVTLSRRILS